MMKIVLVHDGYFPKGTAFASRLYNLAEMFFSCGIETHVIASYTKDESIKANCVYKEGNVTFQITDIRNRGSIDTFFGPYNFIRTVIKYINTEKVDAVVTSRGITYYTKLIKECKKRGIRCFVEQCEWLDISSFKFGKIDPRYLRMNYLFEKGYKSADGIIAISKLLEEHFAYLGVKTIRIPTILDVIAQPCSMQTGNKKTIIVFTGSLGSRKELLSPIISVMKDDRYLQENIEFHIYGPSREQVKMNLDDPSELEGVSNVQVHGFVEHSEVQEAIRNADFQYFIRPNRRSSNAGFPTKLGESLSVGTPCITNNTGDILLYLKNGKNSYIVGEDINSSLAEILKRIISQTKEERMLMRKAARTTAEQNFDLRNYKAVITDFLKH